MRYSIAIEASKQSEKYSSIYLSMPPPLAHDAKQIVQLELWFDHLQYRLLSLTPPSRMNVQVKPIPSSINGGTQVQQIVNIECLNLFYDAPLLTVKFK